MESRRPTYQLLDAFVDAMTSGRIPTRPTFVCPICYGPAVASASPREDVLSVSIRCPCSALELDGVPKWPGWESLLLPPPEGFIPDPLGLTRRRSGAGRFRRPSAANSLPCPYCGAPLGTAKARQCFVCGTDWHEPQKTVYRENPERQQLGLEWRQRYVAELCQAADGRRYVAYRHAETGTPDRHRAFEIAPQPGWQWIAWGRFGFSDEVVTTTDVEFTFDGDENWLTWDEARVHSTN